MPDFHGAKAALICEGRLAVLRRDDISTISWPDRIDLPGGAREGTESPEECASREAEEEIGLSIALARFHWGRAFEGQYGPSWLLAADITAGEARSLKLGDEGQACWMMGIADYLASDAAIPHQQARLQDYLASRT